MNSSTTPQVSVVMAVYNGETYLGEAITSILQQTFRDFEWIIINDGSSDATESILAGLADPRMLVVRNSVNQGLPSSLNTGIALARGKYLARMDVDDLAMPERFAKQVAFLEAHPEFGIVGSRCQVIDEVGNPQGIYEVPLHDLDIRWTSLLSNPFIHASVMLRREILDHQELRYDPAFKAAQDYELWTRLLEYTRGANFEELLGAYRINNPSIVTQHRDLQLRNHDLIAFRTIRQHFPDFPISQDQVSRLREVFVGGGLARHERKQQHVRFAAVYLDLLRAFAHKYRQHPDIKALQRRETLKIGKMVTRLRYRSYWLPVMRRAVRLYPGIAAPLLKYLFKKYVWNKHK